MDDFFFFKSYLHYGEILCVMVFPPQGWGPSTDLDTSLTCCNECNGRDRIGHPESGDLSLQLEKHHLTCSYSKSAAITVIAICNLLTRNSCVAMRILLNKMNNYPHS